jgi:hypothetical protein
MQFIENPKFMRNISPPSSGLKTNPSKKPMMEHSKLSGAQ